MPFQPIKAVAFDMDGVLVDSEIVYLRHQLEVLHPDFPQVRETDLYPTVGMSDAEYRPFLAKLLGFSQHDPEFQRVLAAVSASCTIHFREILRPGTESVLKTLKGMGMQLALASSSPKKEICQMLRECGLGQYFDCVVSGEEFARSKPDPEIYRCTFRRLGRMPEECLIVEDSTYGVAAGAASGAVVAALRDDRFPFDQSPARLRIDALAEVPRLAACGGRRIQAAFFDIDGTLGQMGTHKIPQSVGAALEALRKNGIARIVCTGRHPIEIEQENLLPDLAFDGAVYLNGQICVLHGKTVSRNKIPEDDLLVLRRFLVETGRSCIFMEESRIYCNRVDERIRLEQSNIGTSVPPVQPVDGLEHRDIYQVIPFISREEEQELLARMPHCKSMRWGENVIDINSQTSGKASGIQTICNELGILPENVIAFGDGENDMDMLSAAGIGVAMGNALPCVKEIADYVTETVEQDGILRALQNFRLL